MRGSCASCPIEALAHPPRAPWEKAPAGSLKLGKCDNEESYGKVQGSVEEGRHDFWGMSRGLATRHDREALLEGDLSQEAGVAWRGETCW